MDSTLVIIASTLSAIAMLVLASAGLAVIFGLMRVVNMAHGEFLMLGALTTTSLVNQHGLPWWLAMAIAPVVGAVAGALLQFLLLSRISQGRIIDTLLVTFGVSLVMYQLAVNIFGTTPPGIEAPFGSLQIGRYSVSGYSLFIVGAALALLFGLYILFSRTGYGLLARATAQNDQMAQALGVSVRVLNIVTVAIGCGVAALGGALLAPMVSVSPSLGQIFVGQAFMTVVIAGPAFIVGLLLSASLLATISSLLSQALTSLWGLTGLFLAAIVLLRFHPIGLSGKWKRSL